MMLVTVGTHPQGFDRLVRAVDGLFPGKSGRDVVMQIGNTEYEPKNCKWFRFASSGRIESLYKSADIIITHGGAGSIINSLKYGKKPVVVPRMKKHGEHNNDHQMDLTRFLEREGKVIAVYDIRKLKVALKAAGKTKYKYKRGDLMARTVEGFIEKCAVKNG